MKKCQPRALTPFLDGELTEDAWQELDDHLQSCPTCSTQLDELTTASQRVRAMGRAQVPDDSLKSALDVVAERAGLSSAVAMKETTEIARAKPAPATETMTEAVPAIDLAQGIAPAPQSSGRAVPPPIIQEQGPADAETSARAWSPDETPIKQFPEIGVHAGVDRDQPRAPMGAEIEASEGVTPVEAADPAPEDAAEPVPTWVEPGGWHPAGAADTTPPPSVPSRPPGAEVPAAEVEPAEPAEEPDDAAEEPNDAAEQPNDAPEEPHDAAEQPNDAVAPIEVPEAELEPGRPGLETHPSPPPAQLVPSWMETPSASDAELEVAGRAAVDDALAPPDGSDLDGPADIVVPPGADYVGPTSAAEAALRAPLEPHPGPDQDAAESAQARRLSWFAAILRPRRPEEPESAAGPEETEAGVAGVELAGAELAEAEPLMPAPEARERPEAERLMWITPRTPLVEPVAAIEPLPEIEAAPAPAPDSQRQLEFAAIAGTPARELTPALQSEPEAPDDDDSHQRSYREALVGARATPDDARARLLSSPETRIRVGLALALLAIFLGVGILYTTRSTHPTPTAVTKPATSHAATPSPASPPTPTDRPSPAPSPASGAALGPLSELVTAGSGGSGWTVARIRLGSPGNGITRVVLDLNGTGSAPTAQLGRAGDGSIYLSAPGLAISPSVVSGLTPSGALTAITDVGGSGTTLKFTTRGKPGFSVGYLAGPNRLVLDFK